MPGFQSQMLHDEIGGIGGVNLRALTDAKRLDVEGVDVANDLPATDLFSSLIQAGSNLLDIHNGTTVQMCRF